jgi:hypothetical protein
MWRKRPGRPLVRTTGSPAAVNAALLHTQQLVLGIHGSARGSAGAFANAGKSGQKAYETC